MTPKCENCSRGNKTSYEKESANGSYTYLESVIDCSVLEFEGVRPNRRGLEQCCDYFSPIGDPNPLPIAWEGEPKPENEVKPCGKRQNKRKD